MSENVLSMIESGKALEMVKHYIAEKKRVRAANVVIAQELGVEDIFVDRVNGTISAVRFPGKRHPDFTKETRRGAWPKKGTDWHHRFADQVGYENQSAIISETFAVPLSISYKRETGESHGWRCIGGMLNECGFLWLGEDGPYAMWIPDVEAEVASDIAKGYSVAEPARSFTPAFAGCRRIENEEWDILVAELKLARKRAAVTA
jgi:hypothetical protein